VQQVGTKAAKQPYLLVKVVADDALVPGFAHGLEDIAQGREQAGGRHEGLGGRGGGGIEASPALIVDIGFDPAMGIALANGVVVTKTVVGTADEAGDVACWNIDTAKEDGHGGREVFAMAASGFE